MNDNCFDFLRFSFSVNIMLAHLCVLSNNESFNFLLGYTDSLIGIKGFFVISGFLVAKSYTNSASLKNYFIKRAKRILPAYFFVILLSVFSLSIVSKYSFYDYFFNENIIKYLASNLVFLNFLHPCLPGVFENNIMCVVNGSLWTLKVEEGFYLVLPILFYIIKKTKKPFLFLLLVYLCSIFYWFIMTNYFHNPILAKQLPGYLSYFAGGIFLYINFDLIYKHKTILLAVAVLFLWVSKLVNFEIDIIYPIAFATLVITIAFSFKFLNNFGKYGDFTYGIYIFHFPIIQIFKQYDLFVKYNTLLMGFCVVSITFLLAIFSWFFIEKRFLDRFKKNAKLNLA